jgi:hypothetical protein
MMGRIYCTLQRAYPPDNLLETNINHDLKRSDAGIRWRESSSICNGITVSENVCVVYRMYFYKRQNSQIQLQNEYCLNKVFSGNTMKLELEMTCQRYYNINILLTD